jgi:DNA-binding transcriptional regulator YdaS (Cro superfamily)
MELSQWLKSERGRQARLARHLKVSAPVITEWLSGDRPVPVRHGMRIEQFTGGQVSRLELYGEECLHIWPELAAPDTASAQAAEDGVVNG